MCVFQRYAADARVEVVDGLTLLKEISQDLENMMSDKVDAIKVKLFIM